MLVLFKYLKIKSQEMAVLFKCQNQDSQEYYSNILKYLQLETHVMKTKQAQISQNISNSHDENEAITGYRFND